VVLGVRSLVVFFIGGLAMALAWGATETAPDVPIGMSQDTVIARYGWPRGKSIAGARENPGAHLSEE